jgi:DNA-binding response OmpR family regulator
VRVFLKRGVTLTTCGVAVRILLVEDDEDLRTEIREYLQRRGHDVTACGSLDDARAAVRRLAARNIAAEAIVCDVNLPDGNGIDFYAASAAELPTCHWVLMSGAHDVARIDGLSAGKGLPRCTIVEKPMSLRILNSALNRI